ncbi:MAG: glutamate synthase subunit beta [Clostridiales bacterium]|nr:glutamate synthase subunit beta [Clostridiales bacterium]
MGKPTGFIEYERKGNRALDPAERVKNYQEFYTPLSEKERKEQAARCKDCGVPFCQAGCYIDGMVSGCPLNNLVPEWNDFLYRGNYQQAWHRLHKTNNFPEFTSRVCPAFCEAACTGLLHDTAVTNRDNERAIVEYSFEQGWIQPQVPSVRTDKRIAIIGSGPAGLAAADQLNSRGHHVTIYERDDRPGGLLMYGIPTMKLGKNIVMRRIHLMEASGIKFVLNTEVGKDISAQDLLRQYDAVILACGATDPRDLNFAGRDAEGVEFALPYLRSSIRSVLDGTEIPPVLNAAGKNVLVIGGGDTANDCIGTAVRQGCKSVVQFTRQACLPLERPADNPWPQRARVLKTDYGQEEAAAVFGKDPRMYETKVKEFLKNEEGKLVGVKGIKLKKKKDAKTGRVKMVEIAGSEFEIPCELALIASGFQGVEKSTADAFELPLDGNGNLPTTSEKNHATSNPKVFAAGDCRRGASLVVWAIREGRETAKAVDTFLMGYSNLPD